PLDRQPPQGVLGGELMAALTAPPRRNIYTAGKLGRWVMPVVLVATVAVTGLLFLALGAFGIGRTVVVGVIAFAVVMVLVSSAVEGVRKAKDRLATILVTTAFCLALLPLISLIFTTVSVGLRRFDLEFFSYSMRNIVGAGGGAAHAITGTLWTTGIATVISVPIGILAAVYLVEYGQGRLAGAITFFVDVMTGIPSIVAGLFAYSLFVLVWGPGTKTAVAGAVALSVLMIPIVVRSSEELLRLVPNE